MAKFSFIFYFNVTGNGAIAFGKNVLSFYTRRWTSSYVRVKRTKSRAPIEKYTRLTREKLSFNCIPSVTFVPLLYHYYRYQSPLPLPSPTIYQPSLSVLSLTLSYAIIDSLFTNSPFQRRITKARSMLKALTAYGLTTCFAIIQSIFTCVCSRVCVYVSYMFICFIYLRARARVCVYLYICMYDTYVRTYCLIESFNFSFVPLLFYDENKNFSQGGRKKNKCKAK